MEWTNYTQVDLKETEDVSEKTRQLEIAFSLIKDLGDGANQILTELMLPTVSDTSNMIEPELVIKEAEVTKKTDEIPMVNQQSLNLNKYYARRYSLFHKFDEGIKLDEESWFSVTPEILAKHIAHRTVCNIVVDPFCGAGGNIIQFALTCAHVIAIDIDPFKLECAKNNARIYGVESKIDFVLANALTVLPLLRGKADVVFLCPPWGGPAYSNQEIYNIEKMGPLNGLEILDMTRSVTPNVVFLLPKNIDPHRISTHCGDEDFEVEKNLFDSQLKTVTAYFGTCKIR